MSNKRETITDEEYNKILLKSTQNNNITNPSKPINTEKNTNTNTNTEKNTNTKNKRRTDDISLKTLSPDSIDLIDKISNKSLDRNSNETAVNSIKEEAKDRFDRVKSKTKELGEKTTRGVKKALGMKVATNDIKTIKKRDDLVPEKPKNKIISIIFITILFLAVIFAGFFYYKYYILKTDKGLVLLKKPKDASNTMVISQNPTKRTNLFINKSFNKEGGIEFTYSFWMVIKNMDLVNKNKWKHVFHKGERNVTKLNNENEHTSLMSPGVFIHPSTNTLRIYLVVPSIELNKTLEYIDISNIPLRKWVNITFTFTQQKIGLSSGKILHNSLDVYVNGLLKTRKLLSRTPKQFDKDLWINLNRGFDGLFANLKYYDSAIGPKEIYNILQECPSETSCGLKADCPEYLSSNWWLN